MRIWIILCVLRGRSAASTQSTHEVNSVHTSRAYVVLVDLPVALDNMLYTSFGAYNSSKQLLTCL